MFTSMTAASSRTTKANSDSSMAARQGAALPHTQGNEMNGSHSPGQSPSTKSRPQQAQPSSGFSSQHISLRVQKKLLGKMSNRAVAKHFISDVATRVLDNLFGILRDTYSRKESEKVIKNIIKITVKLGILERNKQLTLSERELFRTFQIKFHMLAMTVTTFGTVDCSYDRPFIIDLLTQCRDLLDSIVDHHLSGKSALRLEYVFERLVRPNFLDKSFANCGPGSKLECLSEDLNQLMEDGDI